MQKVFILIKIVFLILIIGVGVSGCKKRNKSKSFKSSEKSQRSTTYYNKKEPAKTATLINEIKKKENESKNRKEKVEKMLAFARSQIGVPYKFGGTDQNGFDCSGLTSQSYNHAGIEIPRTAGEQAAMGKEVSIHELALGDLVFFTNKKGNTKITHVGIVSYVSDKSVKFIHASTSRGVVENELLTGYYRDIFIKAVRYVF